MSDGLVPIGTIIDWWRDEDAPIVQPFPTGYQVCDGSEIKDGILKGQRTPNLRSMFIRGVTAADQIGQTGGSEVTALPESTGSCYDGGSDPGKHPYKVRDDNQGWDSDIHLRVDDGDSEKEGQHRHRLGGTVPILPPFYSLLKLMRIS
jgi:hypothetical protein